MRWTPLALFALILPPLVTAAPVPNHLMKDEPFWPTAVGTKWVYEQNGIEYPEEIVAADIGPKGTGISVRLGQGDDGGQDEYYVTPSGITLLSSASIRRLDRLMARFPLKLGDSWAVKFPVQDGPQGETGEAVVGGSQEITVPAGKFQAATVVFTATKLGDRVLPKPLVTTSWYARGVGLVQCETWGGVLKLKSFTPGPK